MVSYTTQKREQLSLYVTLEEYQKIENLASEENRSISNFLYNKIFGDKNENI